MNGAIKHALHCLVFLTAAHAALWPLQASAQAVKSSGTFVVRSGPRAPAAGTVAAPANIIAGQAVGEPFCNALQCVVFTSTAAQVAALTALQSAGLLTLEPLPDARKVYFAKARYDADAAAFEADFPGRTETNPLFANALFAVVFKAWPERDWISALEQAGLYPVAPMQSMAWLFYGPRAAITDLPKQFAYIYGATDLPAGLKRFNLDTREEGDDDGPQWTYVHVVAASTDTIARLLLSSSGSEPGVIDRTPTVISYSTPLTRQEAIDLASFPEVLSVRRMSRNAGPSDERSNRIVGGDFAAPGTTYTQATVTKPANYWNNYLNSLFGLGVHPENQLIGLLETGVAAGLREGGASYCPPFLRAGSACRLAFAADTTSGDADANTRGDDYWYHGSLVASIIAGDNGSDSPGYDGDSFFFTQGVAGPYVGHTQGAKLALSKFWTANPCKPDSYRTIHGVSLANTADRLRYSVVELSATTNLPDYNINGPGVTLFNHSWNDGTTDYDEPAVILDRSARRLNYYSFTYDNGTTLYGASGQNTPALHVVAAGNDFTVYNPPYPEAGPVQSPATARNVITVGASESYNQQGYGTGACTAAMAASDANDQRQVALFSRIGWSFNHAKPDLVAPGTRSYGGSTTAASPCGWGCNENITNAGSGQPHYQWASGTSFATPVVTGAAALARDWLRALGYTNPSPALTKATVLTATKNLAPCNPGCTNPPPACTSCSWCGTMLPRPDRHQGWGGLSLNELFRPATNYFFRDQQQPFTANGQNWSQALSVVDHTLPIEITLVWTDAVTVANIQNPVATLVNDLDLRLDVPGPGGLPVFTGDYYYTCITCCDRQGFSIGQVGTLHFDHKNNVERISLPANTFGANGTQFYLTVTATSLQGDGIDPGGNTPRQDFAIAVSNAH